MKVYYLILILTLSQSHLLFGQYTLEQCVEKAQSLSPQAKQTLYYNSIAELKKMNLDKSNLPQLQLNGQFTYQSDVFELPFSIPGAETPTVPKDQYKVALNIQQKIYDGGTTKAAQSVVDAENAVNQQQVEVSLYQIRSIINQLYFGALLYQENENILGSVKAMLEKQLTEVESRAKNGVILSSNVNIIKKEILNKEQDLLAVRYDKNSALKMLNQWTGFNMSSTDELTIPQPQMSEASLQINRPEMKLFELKSKQLEAAQSTVRIRNRPQLFAFAQGGVGNPNPLNFFETDLSEFYIAGLKLQWNFLDYNRKKNDIKQLQLQSDIINTQQNDFVRRTSIALSDDEQEIQKMKSLIKKDEEILDLQASIVEETYAQLNNGVITSTQYITELNKQTTAQLNKRIHELMLIKAQIELLTKSGN